MSFGEIVILWPTCVQTTAIINQSNSTTQLQGLITACPAVSLCVSQRCLTKHITSIQDQHFDSRVVQVR